MTARHARATRAEYVAEIPKRMAAWRDEAAAAARIRPNGRSTWRGSVANSTGPCRPTASWSPMAGLPAHWTGLLYDTKIAGRHFIPDRGLASIGYGLPGGIGAALAAPGNAGRRDHRRWRLQHDAGRTRNRAPRRDRADDRRRQQRRIRLCEGVAARDVPRPLSILRPRRNGLRRDRPRHGVQWHSRRGPGPARRRAGNRAWPSAPGRPCSTSSSRATPRACSPPSTTARSRSSKATGSRDRRRLPPPLHWPIMKWH